MSQLKYAMEIESKICKNQNYEKNFSQSIILYMKTVEKKVIRNKGTEDCYIATCNQAVLRTQCTEDQPYNKKEKEKRSMI